MKIERLVVFGDSWPAGAEMEDYRLCFPFLLASRLGSDLLNLSEPATSVDHAVWSFVNYVEKECRDGDFVLFCVTGKSRSMTIQDGIRVEINPSSRDPISHAYYKYVYSDELSDWQLIKNLYLVSKISTQRNIRSGLVMNWDPVPSHFLLSGANISEKTLASMIDVEYDRDWGEFYLNLNESRFVSPNESHPNALGHARITDALMEWITKNE